MKRINVPIRILEIQGQGSHLLIDGRINGAAICLVVDTGASRTVFDHAFLAGLIDEEDMVEAEEKSAGLGVNDMQSFIGQVKELRFGRLKLKDIAVVGIDLENIRDSYEMLGLPEIHGVLGGDILLEYQAVIDYGKARIMFRMPDLSE